MANDVIYCANCGASNSRASRFCVQCGSALSPAESPQVPPSRVPQIPAASIGKQINAALEAVPLWAWLGLLGLAVIASYFLFGSRSQPSAATTEESPSSEASSGPSAAGPVAATPTVAVAPSAATPSFVLPNGWKRYTADGLSFALPGDFVVANSVDDLHPIAEDLRALGNDFDADYIEGIDSYGDSPIKGIKGWFEEGRISLFAVPLSDTSDTLDDVTIYPSPSDERSMQDAIEALRSAWSSDSLSFEELNLDLPGEESYAVRVVLPAYSEGEAVQNLYICLLQGGDILWEFSISTDFQGWDFSEADVDQILQSLEIN